MLALIPMFLLVTYTTQNVPEEIGTYKIEYSHEEAGVVVSDEFNFTVTSKNTIMYEDLAIDASDFYITDEDNLSKQLIVNKSEVKIWNMKTQEEYDVSSVEYYKVEDNLYEAVITSKNNIAIKINIYIVTDAEYEEIYGLGLHEKNNPYSDSQFMNYSIFKPLMIFILLIAYLLLLLELHIVARIRRKMRENIDVHMMVNNLDG